MAGTLIATLPMVLLYLVGQRFFIEGLVAGAVK
jgi:ABC-type glycerol-3-phosphate transport system permease component